MRGDVRYRAYEIDTTMLHHLFTPGHKLEGIIKEGIPLTAKLIHIDVRHNGPPPYSFGYILTLIYYDKSFPLTNIMNGMIEDWLRVPVYPITVSKEPESDIALKDGGCAYTSSSPHEDADDLEG